MRPIDTVLSRIDARQSGRDQWEGCCPAHDDDRESLSIGMGEDGKALINCHAGCQTKDVLASVGLRMGDLFPRNGSAKAGPPRHIPSNNGNGGESGIAALPAPPPLKRPTPPPVPSTAPKPGVLGKAIEKAAEWLEGREAGRWEYQYADSSTAFYAVRFQTPGGKDYRPFKTDGKGGWIMRAMESNRPLYRLPELSGAERVYVFEGEKCVELARSLGLTATTTANGAKGAKKSDWSPLAGKEVVIVPDHDSAGEGYASKASKLLADLSPPPTVKLLGLPGLERKGDDLEQFIEQRRESGMDDDGIAAELIRLADDAPVEEAEQPAPPPGLEPYRPFPVDALPHPVRGFVASNTEAMGCDPSFVALPLLSALASAIGNTRRIQLKRTWSEPAIIWTAIVGESGTLKSPAMAAALAPVRKADRRAGKEYAAEMEGHEHEQLVYECDLKQWKSQRSRKGDGGAGEPPEQPKAPVMVRYEVEDVTTEALAPILADNWRGLLLARDELAGWLCGFNQYKGGQGGDVAAWLNFHGGRSAKVDRKASGPKTIHIPRATVSVAGGIQPGTLKRALGVERFQDGLAARLLLAMPPTRRKRWTEAEGDAKAERELGEVFTRLYALEPDRDAEGAPQPVKTPLSDEGLRAWISFYNAHNAESVELGGDLRAAWAKLEGYAARLALVVHFIRWAADDPTLADPNAVDERSMKAGIALSRWFGGEARRVYALLCESDEDAERRKLVEWIQGKGGSTTVRDLTRGPREYRGDSDAAEKALNGLVKCGLGRWEAGDATSKGGRPTRYFILNDTGDGDRTPPNPPLHEVSSPSPPLIQKANV